MQVVQAETQSVAPVEDMEARRTVGRPELLR